LVYHLKKNDEIIARKKFLQKKSEKTSNGAKAKINSKLKTETVTVNHVATFLIFLLKSATNAILVPTKITNKDKIAAP